jgi:hypothetical protein
MVVWSWSVHDQTYEDKARRRRKSEYWVVWVCLLEAGIVVMSWGDREWVLFFCSVRLFILETAIQNLRFVLEQCNSFFRQCYLD